MLREQRRSEISNGCGPIGNVTRRQLGLSQVPPAIYGGSASHWCVFFGSQCTGLDDFKCCHRLWKRFTMSWHHCLLLLASIWSDFGTNFRFECTIHVEPPRRPRQGGCRGGFPACPTQLWTPGSASKRPPNVRFRPCFTVSREMMRQNAEKWCAFGDDWSSGGTASLAGQGQTHMGTVYIYIYIYIYW